MTSAQEMELRNALLAAFTYAIQRVGMAAFKATSMFGSNDRKAIEKQAA
jgi:hypothetical protein